MTDKKFSIREALSFGSDKTVEHAWLWLQVAAALLAVIVVLSLGFFPLYLFLRATQDSFLSVIPFTLICVYLLTGLLTIVGILRLGLVRIAVDIYERNSSEVSRLFSIMPQIPTSILGTLLYGLMYVPYWLLNTLIRVSFQPAPASILILISFLITFMVRVRFSLYDYAIVDQKLSAIDSLKRSWLITKGSFIKLSVFDATIALYFLICACLLAINFYILFIVLAQTWLLGALLIGVLLIFVLLSFIFFVPFVLLATVYVYKKLTEHTTVVSASVQAPEDSYF